MRRRWVAALGAALVLAALVLAATSLQLGTSNVNTLAKEGDAKQGLLALERSGIGSGVLVPGEVLISGSSSPDGVASALAAVPGVHGAVAPNLPDWRHAAAAVVDEFPTPDASTAGRPRDARARHLDRPRERHRRQPRRHRRTEQGLHRRRLRQLPVDDPADRGDHLHPARARLPLAAAAAEGCDLEHHQRRRGLGRADVVWQNGHGSNFIWGIPATGSVTAWIPLMVFAFLFGLSMDYEVFILSRMREEYDRTGSTDVAVVSGIGRTGRLVTSAALILFLAFVSLASGPQTEIKVLATGLAAGILLDATLIRALLVPAVVSLFGRWNWWLPPMPARLLRVEPSPSPRVAAEGAGP